jgi:hypothetical protein
MISCDRAQEILCVIDFGSYADWGCELPRRTAGREQPTTMGRCDAPATAGASLSITDTGS